MTMDLREYWSLPPSEQAEISKAATPPPPLYRGKYQHLFGCPGKVAESDKCFEQRHGFRPGDCSCPCHSDCGGDW